MEIHLKGPWVDFENAGSSFTYVMWENENGGFRIPLCHTSYTTTLRMLLKGRYRISIVLAFSSELAKTIRLDYKWTRFCY